MARRKRNLLDSTLVQSDAAVCVLDAERRIRFVTPGLTEQTGWEADQLEGLLCSPLLSDTADSVEFFTAALAPPACVMEGTPCSIDVVLPRRGRGGESLTGSQVTLTYMPLTDEDCSVNRIIVLARRESAPAASAPPMTQRLHAELTTLRLEFRRRYSDGSWIGDSAASRLALNQGQMLSTSECDFEIIGPSGSGRRHLAGLIHTLGMNRDTSFVILECRLLTAPQLLDALRQLRQASADATAAPGRVGTLVLMEADQCPREVQEWILKHISEERRGVRLVALTEQPLEEAEQAGWVLHGFRMLFSAVRITLPPLHHRSEDLLLLAQYFIEDNQRTQDTSAESMSDEFVQKLQFYRWPGNIRELRQVISEACQNSFSSVLEPDDLPFSFRAGMQSQQLPDLPSPAVTSLEELLRRFERDVLTQTLEACSGNKAEAARRLGMTRPRLYRRLRSLGMEDDDDES